MADESLTLPCDPNNSIEYHIVTLFEKIEELRRDKKCDVKNRQPIQEEIRSLEFWRSIISECMASFFYVFIVCGAAAGAGVGASLSSVLLATALSAGFAMTTLTHCFGHISGAHVNPAVTLAMAVTRNVSPIRAAMFLLAQCGGGIAGAAVLYGVTIPGYTGNLSAAVAQTTHVAAWERFGVEFILSFIVVFSYFVSMDTCHKYFNTSAITIGAAYTTCTFVSMPYLNPARSLGPSFVLNKWENHWVYWFGPMVGGVVSGLIYEFIFNPRRYKRFPKESIDDDNSSIHSDQESYDDLDKGNGQKFHGCNYNTYRSAQTGTLTGTNTGGGNYCASLTSNGIYSTNPGKLNRVESLYGGTKSLYCKSPPLTRANLNRSQSVYTKSNCNVNLLPRPGPLVPAQSLYPIRLNQQQSTHVQNQNVQNQMQQCSENIYGVRGVATGASTSNRSDSSYGPVPTTQYDQQRNYNRQEPPYGTNTVASNRSDSGYGTSNNSNRSDNTNFNGNTLPTFTSNGNNPNRNTQESAYGTTSSSSNRSDPAYHTNRTESEYPNGFPNTYPQQQQVQQPQPPPPPPATNEESKKCNNVQQSNRRPESMYGTRRLNTEEQYTGPPPPRNTNGPNPNYINSVMSYKNVHSGNVEMIRPSPPPSAAANSNAAAYHHQRPQHSPNNQQY